MVDVVEMVKDIISVLGFPIAACIFMALFIVKERKDREEAMRQEREEREQAYEKQRLNFSEMLEKVEESHASTINAIKTSLDSNTEVVRTLIEVFKGNKNV